MTVRNEMGMTQAQLDALRWLHERGSHGVFLKWPYHGTLLASGNMAPFQFSTWMRLKDLGFVSYVKPARCVDITEAGFQALANCPVRVTTGPDELQHSTHRVLPWSDDDMSP